MVDGLPILSRPAALWKACAVLTLISLSFVCKPTACNCDPMGSTSMQCHSNGTCPCRQGFVGYKCDKCELNHYLNRVTQQCQECPVCYSLIRDQVPVCVDVFVLYILGTPSFVPSCQFITYTSTF